MKKKLLNLCLGFSIFFGIISLFSCYQPSPLNGTWADNRGDQITLFPNYSYSAKITNNVGERKTYNGSYNVLMNAISFTAEDGYQVVSEWDIRGSMLYLEWPDADGKKLQLTLYKTKN